MKCTVDDAAPEHEATHQFTWAWGQKGATCDEHRAIVESQAAQVQRGISWEPIEGEPKTDPGRGRRSYVGPHLTSLAPELGELRMKVAELASENQRLKVDAELYNAAKRELSSLHARTAELETELAELRAQVRRGRGGEAEESVIEGAPKP